MEMLRLLSVGLVLGVVVVIPGVSAGTIAVVFNIYERLIEIITPNIKKILAAWKFWLPLAIGAVAGIFFFSRIITILFTNYPVPTHWFFIGIITGSLPLIYSRLRQPGRVLPAIPVVLCCVLGLAVMVMTAVLNPAAEAALYTVLTPQLFASLAAGSALAAAALVIPGISGAFLLLVIGLYRTAIQAVSDLNIPLIAPVALGAILGLLAGAALVRLLLAKAPRATYGVVLGLVAGSVIVLFPGGLGDGVTVIFSIASMLAGGAVSFFSGRHSHTS